MEDFLPASIGALLLQKKTLSASGLQILEFEGMDSLRVVARKVIRDLGFVLSQLAHGASLSPCRARHTHRSWSATFSLCAQAEAQVPRSGLLSGP